MPVYKAKIWYTSWIELEVQAKDTEDAIEQAIMQGIPDSEERNFLDRAEAMEFNNEVELADCQYTDQQELEDRERDHER
jgi:hypothetical protein